MLFLVLEAAAVTRASLDGQAYEEVCRHPELRSLEESGRHVLSEWPLRWAWAGAKHRRRRTVPRGCAHGRGARAGANVTRIPCAGCEPRAYVCRLTWRLVGTSTATAVTVGSLSWPHSPCITFRLGRGDRRDADVLLVLNSSMLLLGMLVTQQLCCRHARRSRPLVPKGSYKARVS
jgi:hypothetical protein